MSEKIKRDVAEAAESNSGAKPRKLMLDKRVVRAFGVRSGVKTGLKCQETSCGISQDTGSATCGRSR